MPLKPRSASWAVALALLLTPASTLAQPPASTVECIQANENGQALLSAGNLDEAEAELERSMSAACPGPLREDSARLLAEIGERRRAAEPPSAPDPNPSPLEPPAPATVSSPPVASLPSDLTPSSSLPPRDETAPSGAGSISPLTWVGFGIGAAGLVAGSITGALALGKASDVTDQCVDGRCPRATSEADYDAAHTLAHVSTTSFVIGGVGVALGLVGLFVLSGDEGAVDRTAAHASRARWQIEPVLGLGAAGLRGRF